MKRSRAGVATGLLLTTAAALAVPALAQPSRKQPAQPAPTTEPTPPPPTQGAEPAATLTLPEVLEHAVRQSPQLANARIDVEVAEAGYLEATGLEDFLLNVTGLFERQHYDSADDNFPASDENLFQGSIALSKLLWTGGSVSLRGDTRRGTFSGDENAPGMDVGNNASSSITLQIQQPLLRGRGETTTRAARTRAQFAEEQARLQREVAGRTVVRDLIAAYWEVAYAWGDLEIRRSSLDLARERRRLTDASVRGGATAPTEVLAVDQVIAQREEDVVVAELAVTERSLELRRLAGLEIAPDQIDVRTGAPLSVDVKSVEMTAVVTQAIEQSPEIAVLQSQERGAQLEVEVTDNGLLPRLDLRVYGGPFGVGPELGDSLENIRDGYVVGGEVVLEHWLGNNGAQGRSRRAQAERQRVKVNIADIRRQIVQSAAQAGALAKSAEKRMQLSRTAIDLTQRNIKAETGRFELGKSSNFDVLLRQEEHTQARLRYARAAADYLRAAAFLEALTGEILTRYGIKMQ